MLYRYCHPLPPLSLAEFLVSFPFSRAWCPFLSFSCTCIQETTILLSVLFCKFMKTLSWYIFLSLLLGTEQVVGRERWLERKNKPVFLDPRRFGQEQPPVLQKLQNACPGQVCGVLAGQAVTPLLAAQPECSQQDMADQIIGRHAMISRSILLTTLIPDACRQFDVDTQANIIAIAKDYRQVEKNTPPVNFYRAKRTSKYLYISRCRTSVPTRQPFETRYFARRLRKIRNWRALFKLKILQTTRTCSLIQRRIQVLRRVRNQTRLLLAGPRSK